MAGFQQEDFYGIPLAPFNGIRRYAADCLGLRFFKLHGEAAEQYVRSGTYAGALDDALIVLWLRCVGDSEVMRSRTHPRETGERVWQWAVEHGIEVGNERQARAIQIFETTINEILESIAVPEDRPGKESAGSEPPPLPSGLNSAPSLGPQLDSPRKKSSPARSVTRKSSNSKRPPLKRKGR
jgi:hypothetical protein